MGKRKPRVINTLYDICTGDSVYFSSLYQEGIVQVTHTTPTQIVCGAMRFRRDNGSRVPMRSWNTDHIQILTDTLREQYENRQKRNSLIATIKRTDWSRLTTSALEKIHAIVVDEFLDTI